MKAPEEILGGNVETFMPEKAWGETSANDDKKRFVTINAVDLANKEFPPIRWTVPDILPEGLTVLAGKPKAGKSWLVLDWAVSVAHGGTAMGSVDVEGGDVLYLALEDNQRRLKGRMELMQRYGTRPTRLAYATEAPRVNEGFVERMESWLDDYPETRLIIIDTLQRIRPQTSGNNVYKEDYEAVQSLQDLAGSRNISIVIVHHTRKSDADDIFDTISGSNGLAGSCDNLMVLAKQNEITKLCGRGRDMPDYEKAVTFDPATCTWTIIGDADVIASTSERQAVLDAILDADEPISPKDIAAMSGHNYDCVRKLLPRLIKEDRVQKYSRGLYEPFKKPL
mgnify:CR=1 FL=1